MELGVYVREKRQEKKLSIRKLAELAGISHTEIKRIEDGTRKQPSPQVVRSIASALGVPYEELMIAAGYIDGGQGAATGTTTAGLSDTSDLSDEELAEVNRYIEFIRSKRQ